MPSNAADSSRTCTCLTAANARRASNMHRACLRRRAGARTCFKSLVGIKLGDAMARNKSLLPEEFADASFCEDYDFRCDATARTWLRPHAQDNLL